MWWPIKGYNYEVSEEGEIRNKHKKLLKVDGGKSKYVVVCLSKDGKSRPKLLHRLILETFRGPCPEGMVGCHVDDNNQNNWLYNLKWDTRRESAFVKKKKKLRGSAYFELHRPI